jgi:hypothetical protein
VYVTGIMPRQKNTRPTNIYWLCDSRPEMVKMFGPGGHPFYCGKTVVPDGRLNTHRHNARKYPDRYHSVRVTRCGEHLTMRIIDIVSAEDDWCARECFWIATIRLLYPGGTNIAKGGQGAPGWIPSIEFREKARIARVARNKSPEARAKTSAALKGRKRPPEFGAKISAAKIGTVISPEHRAKISAATRGRKRSLESNARTAAGLRGVKHSPERCAKNSALRKGIKRGPHSLETRSKLSAAKTGKKRKPFTAEARANMSAARRNEWAARRMESACA